MKVVEQSVEIVEAPDRAQVERAMRLLERAMRTCYQSKEDKAKTPQQLLARIFPPLNTPYIDYIQNAHHSILDHVTLSLEFITDRGVTHEAVRHRIGVGYSQESTRFCNYANDRFGHEITVIMPTWVESYPEDAALHTTNSIWYEAMLQAEASYLRLLAAGWTAQQARSVLPNSLKTTLLATYDIRSLRHFFELRCHAKAHPQIKDLAIKALRQAASLVPLVFDDLADHYLGTHYVDTRKLT